MNVLNATELYTYKGLKLKVLSCIFYHEKNAPDLMGDHVAWFLIARVLMPGCPDSCSGSTFSLAMGHWTDYLHFSLFICQMGAIIISTSQSCHED